MTIDEMKNERKLFENWIYNLRKKVWKWEHANLEHEADPDSKEFKGKLGQYSDKETSYLWDMWLFDKEKLKYIYEKMDHKFNYGPAHQEWIEYNKTI
jgi:hypothetical protein